MFFLCKNMAATNTSVSGLFLFHYTYCEIFWTGARLKAPSAKLIMP
jgi:hypothetical protein